jgi:acyl-CoA reductase-like NAD-dependent aldehyde dehydrogenase
MENSISFYSYLPVTGGKTGPFKNMTRKEINTIIELARASKESWSGLSLKKRLAYIDRNEESYCIQ